MTYPDAMPERIPLFASHSTGEEVLLIPLANLDAEDIAAWRALAHEAIEPNPFFEPEFVLPLAVAYPQDVVQMLVVRRSTRWTACLPIVIRRSWGKLPIRVMTTWRTHYSFLGTPLVAAEGIDALVKLLNGAHRACPGLLLLEEMSADGPVANLLSEAISQYKGLVIDIERFERAAVRKRENQSALALSTKRLSEHRRLRRGLEQKCGALRLIDRSSDPAAVEDFLRLEASGWKGRKGTALACHENDALFFREACRGLAVSGRLQILSLEGSRTVAMQCNFISDGVVFGFKTCFDESLSRYSPGVLLMIDALANFDKSNSPRLDSCSHPMNQFVNSLLPDRQEIVTLAIGSKDVKGFISVALVKTTMAAQLKLAKAKRGAKSVYRKLVKRLAPLRPAVDSIQLRSWKIWPARQDTSP
jgi:CelD/BcsL family acetyltransferase involved in cellulose biosynthesis